MHTSSFVTFSGHNMRAYLVLLFKQTFDSLEFISHRLYITVLAEDPWKLLKLLLIEILCCVQSRKAAQDYALEKRGSICLNKQ